MDLSSVELSGKIFVFDRWFSLSGNEKLWIMDKVKDCNVMVNKTFLQV